MLPVATVADDSMFIALPDPGFYHWTLEILPNVVLALQKWPDLRFLIAEGSPQYMIDSLTGLLGQTISTSRMVWCEGPRRVSRLVMPEMYLEGGFSHPQDIALLRSLSASNFSRTKAAARGDKIYVSRRHTQRRRLEGEDLLEQALAQQGFRMFYGEGLSFEEQVREFAGAELVVGPHGAGLSNLIWAQKPCTVLEIFRPDYVNDCFANLAIASGFDYHFVVSRDRSPHIDQTLIETILRRVQEISAKMAVR
jgi:capsular polysaccharide biosynthesis protein